MDNAPLPETYDALVAHADAAFARVYGRWRSCFACRAECSGCCHVHLSLLPIEAERVAAAVERLAPAVVARIRAQAEALDKRDPVCPLLVDRRCAIYADRPLVCRTQGMPLRFAGGTDVCGLNFTSGDPPAEASIDADAINDQLVAIDFLARRTHAVPVSIAEVVRQCAGEE